MPSTNPFRDSRTLDEMEGHMLRVPDAPPSAFGLICWLLLGAFLTFAGVGAIRYSQTGEGVGIGSFAVLAGLAVIYAFGKDALLCFRAEVLKVTIVEAVPDWDVNDQPRNLCGHTIRILALDRYNNHQPVFLVWKLQENYVHSLAPGREFKFYALRRDGELQIEFAELGHMTAQRPFFDYVEALRQQSQQQQLM